MEKVNLFWQSGSHIAKQSRSLYGASWGPYIDRGVGTRPSVTQRGGSNATVGWINGSAAPYALNIPNVVPPLKQSYTSDVTGANNQRKVVRGNSKALYLVYEDEGDIWCTKSTNNGTTWSSASYLSKELSNCSYPAITERNDTLYVVWQMMTSYVVYSIMYNYSLDRGATWLYYPDTLISSISCSSPGPLPVIMAGTPANSFELMIAYRRNTDLRSARTTTRTPLPANWTTVTVNNTNSNSENPSLAYHPTQYGYYRIAWDENSKIYYEQYYTNSWSNYTWVNSGTYGLVTSESSPSVAITGGTNDLHISWQGIYGRGVIVENKNLATTYSILSNSTLSYYKPVITGNNSGRATLLWYDNQSSSQVHKSTYVGGWAGDQAFGSNDKYPTVSIHNPPGDTAYAFWTEGTSAPYSIVTSSYGGPLYKGDSWSYKRCITIASLDTSILTSLELTTPVLITSDGSQIKLSFVTVADTINYTADNVWTAFQTEPFSLPNGVTQAAIVMSRSISSYVKNGTFSMPVAFDVLDASSGAILTEQVIQPTANQTTNPTTDQLILTFQAKAGGQIKFQAHPNVILGNNYSPAIIHRYTASDTTSTQKVSLENIHFNRKPKEYALLPNYPNPFNPSTTIQYQLKEDGFVRMSVFNVLGQDIRTLINETQSAGYKSINFNAGSLPSGVYYVRLSVTDTFGKELFLATEKLLLLK